MALLQALRVNPKTIATVGRLVGNAPLARRVIRARIAARFPKVPELAKKYSPKEALLRRMVSEQPMSVADQQKMIQSAEKLYPGTGDVPILKNRKAAASGPYTTGTEIYGPWRPRSGTQWQSGVYLTPEALAHELGHVTLHKRNPALSKALMMARMMAGKGKNPVSVVLTSLPVLADEAIASYRGIKIMRDAGYIAPAVKHGKKNLAIAYGTYMAVPTVRVLRQVYKAQKPGGSYKGVAVKVLKQVQKARKYA